MASGLLPFGFGLPSLASDDPNSYWQTPLLGAADPGATGSVTLPALSVTTAAAAQPGTMPGAVDPSTPMDGSIQDRFIGALRGGGLTNPNGLGAVAAYAQHESRYSPKYINGSWNDPSESGQAGQSGGILSWRADRLDNMRKATAGAPDPVTAQAQFLLNENPRLTQSLQNAKSPDEANRLMADAWKFAGYNRPGGEFAARLATTQDYVNKLSNGQSVGSTAARGAFGLGGAQGQGPAVPGISSAAPSIPSFAPSTSSAAPAAEDASAGIDPMKILQAITGAQGGQQSAAGAGAAAGGKGGSAPFQVQAPRPKPFALMRFNTFGGAR